MGEQRKRRARRKFTEEFKARAVRLVLKETQTVAQVARDLDLAESVLHGWVRQAKIDRGMGRVAGDWDGNGTATIGVVRPEAAGAGCCGT